jgi:predicted amidohydrolase
MATLTITTIQTNIFWEDKLANLDQLEKKIESIGQRTEVVFLPEMFSTGFTMNAASLSETMEGETVSWMKRTSREKNIILTGSIIIEEEKKYYNRLLWVMPNGQIGYYDKRHLFAFSEEDKYYSAGNKRLITSVKGWKLNMQICYDLRFPVWARQQLNTDGQSAQPEYDILVNVANWPEKRNRAWKTLLSARAIENQCFAVGVNRVGKDGKGHYYSGDSLIINPLGEVQYHMADDEDVFTITLEKEILNEQREKFPFLKDADDFSILL